jgi:hypothetical protein
MFLWKNGWLSMDCTVLHLKKDTALHNHSCENIKSNLLYLHFVWSCWHTSWQLSKSSKNIKFLLWISGCFPSSWLICTALVIAWYHKLPSYMTITKCKCFWNRRLIFFSAAVSNAVMWRCGIECVCNLLQWSFSYKLELLKHSDSNVN